MRTSSAYERAPNAHTPLVMAQRTDVLTVVSIARTGTAASSRPSAIHDDTCRVECRVRVAVAQGASVVASPSTAPQRPGPHLATAAGLTASAPMKPAATAGRPLVQRDLPHLSQVRATEMGAGEGERGPVPAPRDLVAAARTAHRRPRPDGAGACRCHRLRDRARGTHGALVPRGGPCSATQLGGSSANGPSSSQAGRSGACRCH